MAAIADHAAFERIAPIIQGAKSTLDFYLNGNKFELHNPDPEHTLLDFLRSQPSLKGTKLGCGEGGWYDFLHYDGYKLRRPGALTCTSQWRMYLRITDI